MTPIEQAVKLLAHGNVIGLPTETVYGLAAQIDQREGLESIFRLKHRPFFDPLIVHVADQAQAQTCAKVWGSIAQALANKFWPGPLTLVVPKAESISALITSGLPSVGLRCPAHDIALQIIRSAGVPLAAPSANLFGRTSPSRAEHVSAEFGDQVFVVDGGPCAIGIESTIVAIEKSSLTLLRPGQISMAMIERELRTQHLAFSWEGAPVKQMAPGQLQHHYMPDRPLIISRQPLSQAAVLEKAKLRLQDLPAQVEGVTLVKATNPQSLTQINLSADPQVAARELYQSLRQASQNSTDLLHLVWPEDRRHGDWLAIWDRLRKAASLQLD